HYGDEHVGCGGSLARGSRDLGALPGEVLRSRARAVPHRNGETCLQQICHHRLAHQTEPDKSDRGFHEEPPGCLACAKYNFVPGGSRSDFLRPERAIAVGENRRELDFRGTTLQWGGDG